MSAETWLLIFAGLLAFVWLVAGPFIKAKQVIDQTPDAIRRDT
jgi:hypothetical protein